MHQVQGMIPLQHVNNSITDAARLIQCIFLFIYYIYTYITDLLQQKSFLVIFDEVVACERALNPRSYNNTLVHHVEEVELFKMCFSALSTDQSSHFTLI